jgi:serine/threonine protein kinase
MSAVGLVERVQHGVIGRYEIVRELGRGGMAVVFLANDLKHGRLVALKVLRPEVAAALGGERFLQEIRIAARLQHHHILGLFDSGDLDGILYYTMPYVDGESLRDRLTRERQLSLPEALRIADQIAEALAVAHANGVVHRDIKPANVLLVGTEAMVADFGVAKALAEAGGEELTRSGLAVGTPAYMSPEQASGDSHVDGRADIYALACLLYEMLAGEPPFSGRTPQAVIARHLHDPPPSLKVVRPATPDAVQAVIERGLAKVPADRFATVGEFRAALELASGDQSSPPRRGRRGRWRPAAALAAVLTVLALAVWRSGLIHPDRPDPNRIVVFPVHDPSPQSAGEGVATYIGYALEGVAPLRWLDGWDWLSEAQRTGVGALPGPVATQIARRHRARYYVDGLIVRRPDSVTVVLRLHDTVGDSVVKTAGAIGAAGDAGIPQLGVQAVGGLLPALLEPGRKVDLTPLSERKPVAVAAFLQGEQEYRRMRFLAALQHYRAAVATDSVFALAAIKGAQAANWRDLNDEAQTLVDVALAPARGLPPRYLLFAKGLKYYLTGAADSAVARFRDALDLDLSWSEAWMALGETYYHLLPQTVSPDSMAEAAFIRARRADSTFTPPLFHLAEIAMRAGDLTRAKDLIGDFVAADPDSALQAQLEATFECVRSGPGKADWTARLGVADILRAAKILSVGASQAACAASGFRVVASAGGATPNERWASLLGLLGLFTATGQLDSVRALLGSEAATELGGPVLYLVTADALDGALDGPAAGVAHKFGTDYRRMATPLLWALGTWAAHRRVAGVLQTISTILRVRADSSHLRSDSLLAAVMAAHMALAAGDSSTALTRLAALHPTAPLGDLEWQPWESLAAERLALARLLLARGEYGRADEVAALLQAPQPVFYLTYFPAALAVRTRAAVAMGRRHIAERLAARAAALQKGVPAVPAVPPEE